MDRSHDPAWCLDDARALYRVATWSEGYFDIGAAGTLEARPRPGAPAIDLDALTDEIQQAGLRLPVLVRFTDILGDRINRLCDAFAAACERHAYAGRYTVVYPVKVNQQRAVVEHLVAAGGSRAGLEAGSKPELMAVLALAGRQGFLDTEREIENLANVYLFLEIPYKAAQVLTDGMNAGIVDKTLESLEKLGTAWQMARENAQALSVFTEAAPLAADGRIWHRLGQIYIDDENWPKAEEALKNALAKGVNDRGETQLLVGVAAWNQGKTDQARSAFLAARNDSATKSQAQAWLAHLATEG